MKKSYITPTQKVINITIEDHILSASDRISVDENQTGEAGNSYSIGKSEIWDSNWEEE